MRREFPYKLFLELTKLRQEFGDQSFRALARMLSDESLLTEISAIAENLPKIQQKKKSGASRKVSRDTTVGDEITRLEATRSKSSIVLAQFLRSIHEKKLLQDTRSLQSFAFEIGLSPSEIRQPRSAIVTRISKELQKRRPSDIQKYRKLAHQLTKAPSQLAGWTEIIVKGER